MFAKVRFHTDFGFDRTYPSARAAFEAALAGRQTLDCSVFAALYWLATHSRAEYVRTTPTEIGPRSPLTNVLYRDTADIAFLAPCQVQEAQAIDVASHAQWIVRAPGGEWHGLTLTGVETHTLPEWLEHSDMTAEAVARRLSPSVIRDAARLSGEWVVWRACRWGRATRGRPFNVVFSVPRRRVRTRLTVSQTILNARHTE